MFCPQCQAEYREGIVECPDCEVPLVDELPVVPHPERDFVPAFETSDVALLPVVHSLLEAAEIPYVVQGEESMGILPVGQMSGLVGRGKGLVAIFHVDRERLAEAQELLEAVREGDYDDTASDDDYDDAASDEDDGEAASGEDDDEEGG